MSEFMPTRRLVARLLLLVVAMFAFGFALVPLYDVMCRALGINGKTAGDAYQGTQQVDVSRRVQVSFLTTNADGMSWEFRPLSGPLQVHPGESRDALFLAYNPGAQAMTAQAVPSVAPSQAAAYFHKTECFCFTQQHLAPGERVEMPVRFIVDRDLPAEVTHLTLGYTLFDISARVAHAGR